MTSSAATPGSFSRKPMAVVGILALLMLVLVTNFPEQLPQEDGPHVALHISTKAREGDDIRPIRVVCLGDTHGQHEMVQVPEGDVLIFTGDMTDQRETKVMQEDKLDSFAKWLDNLPHEHKIVVSGNHDAEGAITLEDLDVMFSKLPRISYLQDSMATLSVRGSTITIWGAPWEPQYPGSKTYLPEPGEDIQAKWDSIPAGVHIVASHSPPFYHNDLDIQGKHVGSVGLGRAMEERVRPLLHCFGHIHAGFGRYTTAGIHWANGAICNDDLEPVHHPWVYDLSVAALREH